VVKPEMVPSSSGRKSKKSVRSVWVASDLAGDLLGLEVDE
jgi:hypothetical protein